MRQKRTSKLFVKGILNIIILTKCVDRKDFSIAIKPVNMKGGGYSNFLEQVKTDGTTNCLAKFIIIDGDRAVAEEGEKKNLRELLEYCILQNQSGRIPHFLIVDYPDFEYIACLHTPKYKGQDVAQYIVKELGYKSVDEFKADEKVYNVLNANGNSSNLMLSLLRKDNCFIVNEYYIKKNSLKSKFRRFMIGKN